MYYSNHLADQKRNLSPEQKLEAIRRSCNDSRWAQRVVIVPGYGMAVSQCQHQVKEFVDLLFEKFGTEVKYAIHPVAGRMPGHMNVLLAEASVPYDQLIEMDEINPELPEADAAVIIGATTHAILLQGQEKVH